MIGITPETFVPKFAHEGPIKGCYMKDAWGLINTENQHAQSREKTQMCSEY